MSRARLALIVAVVAGLAGVSACTSSAGTATPTSPPPTTSAPPATVVPTPTPTTSAPVPSTTAPTPTPTSSTPTPTSTPTAAPPAAPTFTTTCTTLMVRVIPGGAERGAEIAALQYVNNGSGTCTIKGFPHAVLLRGGQVIGTPSAPDNTTATTRTLAPGDTAESLLTDFSTCQAPLSDTVRVSVPALDGRTGAPVVAAVRLRACTLRVAPVGAPA